ncbi:hypothetical protein QAD02_005055 [Eretmocerus hayati]|uniref:Uncharacterized protein n=1 Tax=Eretmocerus hayati TaxID=131215 RepID=A0ACC2NRF9_9HYME|nr:hypothetical protein QAD02_005055 [Eretmocerus hayati]
MDLMILHWLVIHTGNYILMKAEGLTLGHSAELSNKTMVQTGISFCESHVLIGNESSVSDTTTAFAEAEDILLGVNATLDLCSLVFNEYFVFIYDSTILKAVINRLTRFTRASSPVGRAYT